MCAPRRLRPRRRLLRHTRAPSCFTAGSILINLGTNLIKLGHTRTAVLAEGPAPKLFGTPRLWWALAAAAVLPLPACDCAPLPPACSSFVYALAAASLVALCPALTQVALPGQQDMAGGHVYVFRGQPAKVRRWLAAR